MPDVILAFSAVSLVPLLQATGTVPIVFVAVSDPVGAGFVDSLSRPGGNATGFVLFDYSLSTKWLELLKEIAPGVKRVVMGSRNRFRDRSGGRDPVRGAVAWVSPVNVRDAPEIERGVAAFARSGNGGVIVTGSPLSLVHRELIIALAARLLVTVIRFLRDGSIS